MRGRCGEIMAEVLAQSHCSSPGEEWLIMAMLVRRSS